MRFLLTGTVIVLAFHWHRTAKNRAIYRVSPFKLKISVKKQHRMRFMRDGWTKQGNVN
jgi:hypothetical protein